MAKSDVKNKAHARRMEEKRLDRTRRETIDDTCRLVLLLMYRALVDEFKEEFEFDMEKLSRLRKRMDRYSVYVRDWKETGINQNKIVELLAKDGIDVMKIGDDYVN